MHCHPRKNVFATCQNSEDETVWKVKCADTFAPFKLAGIFLDKAEKLAGQDV